MCAPTALSGLLTYVLLPRMIRVPLAEWLAGVGLENPAFVLFVFYYIVAETQFLRPLPLAKLTVAHTGSALGSEYQEEVRVSFGW